ncbi:DUF2071 domain-containing protein [Streptomyces longwoodensis]|uniref:DUF2071 domain-containing protein n=1 Tax=Streptomyces longwoodensis TaxID=68231 RepID=UPI00384B3F24
MVAYGAEQRVRVPALRAGWMRQAFVHWAYPPAVTPSPTRARWGGRASGRLVVRPGDPIRPTERDVWRTSRWRAYTRRLGLLWETPVEHEPWPLAEASVEVLEETLTRAAGLLAPASAPLVHYSEGVRHVRFGPSRPVGPAAGPR